MNIEDPLDTLGLSDSTYLQFLHSQSEETLRLLLEQFPIGCILLDTNFCFKYWNPAVERIFGYHSTEMVGKQLFDLIVSSTKGVQFDQILREVKSGHAQMREWESTTMDGGRLLCRWDFAFLNMQTPGMLAVVQDIHGEKQVGASHRRQVERIHAHRTIDTAITGSMDFQVTLNIILQQAMSLLGMDAAVVLVYDPSMNVLKFAAGRGLLTDALESTTLRIGEGYAGIAALQKRVMRVPDLQRERQDFTRPPQFYKEGFKSYFCVPLVAKGVIKGVLESFHRTPFWPDAEWLDFLETLGVQAAIAIDNSMLFNELQRSNLELMLAYDTTLEGWSKALDLRDRDTEGHTRRVTEMTDRMAIAFSIKDVNRIHIRRGAILHDIGKMAIPDSILLKEGALSKEEWIVMRRHPILAMNMLSAIPYLAPALDIPYCHHEKWDGSGYPRGLKGEQIPLAARIFTVVDVFDALTSDRPYRPAWSVQRAFGYILEEKGKHFDPKVVDVFMRTIARDRHE